MGKANFFFITVFFLLLFSCHQDTQKNTLVLPQSTGDINSISIVIDDVLWTGDVGDVLRTKLAAPVDGLQDEEPLFTINQYSPKLFLSSIRKARNIIVISKAPESEFKHVIDKYASPQNIFYISGRNWNEIIQTIELHSGTLTSSIRYYEIIESQKNAAKALLNTHQITQKFSINVKIPTTFSYALSTPTLVWLKKELPSGNSSLLFYQVPLSSFKKGNVVDNLIRIRDSIGRLYVHGMFDHSSMQTEESYYPYLSTTTIDGLPAYEIRGTWELRTNFMNGPFINYIIKDLKNKRYMIIEGFAYNPSSTKRDIIFELESSIKSTQF